MKRKDAHRSVARAIRAAVAERLESRRLLCGEHDSYVGSVSLSVPQSARIASGARSHITQIPNAPVIDVLAVYTPNAATQLGGAALIAQRIQESIDTMNFALQNSDVSLSVRLVHTESIAYTGSNNLYTDRIRLHDQNDGVMDQIGSIRNQWGADVVLMVSDGPNVGGGNADLLASLAANVTDNDTRAYAVVAANSIGPGFLTVAHEIGHVIGAGHERDNPDPEQNVRGPFSYSYGYRFTASGQTYHDIMSYDPGQVLPYFANPAVTYLGAATGSPIGSPTEADLASTFAVTGAVVAGYRPTVVTDTTAPTAQVFEINRNGASLDFTLRYTDDSTIDIASIDSSDVLVGGPGGFALPASLVSVSKPTVGGAFKLATYHVTLPTTNPATSSLTFTMRANAVRDFTNHFTAAGTIPNSTAYAAGFNFFWAQDIGALPLGSAKSEFGKFQLLEGDHIYKFTLPSAAIVNATLTGMTGNANLYLAKDLNGDNVKQNNEEIIGAGSFETGTTDESLSFALSAGTYFVVVYEPSAIVTPYNMTIRAYTDSLAPSAYLDAVDVKTAGPKWVDFSLTYIDENEINGKSARFDGAVDINYVFTGGGSGGPITYWPDSSLNTSSANAATKTVYFRFLSFNQTTGWTAAENGTYTISIHQPTGGQLFAMDGAGHAVPVTTLGSFKIAIGSADTTAPTASLAPGTIGPIAGQSTWQFSVIYHDNVAMNASTFDGNDIRVTGPGGYNAAASVVSIGAAPTIGSNRVVTYQVAGPNGYWDGTDDGSYAVMMQANQVRDTAASPLAVVAGQIGASFVTAMPNLVSQSGGSSVAFIGTASPDTLTLDADANFIYFTLNNASLWFIARSNVPRSIVNGLGGNDGVTFNSGAINGVVDGGSGTNTLTINAGATPTIDSDVGASSVVISATINAGGSLTFTSTQHLIGLTVNGAATMMANGNRLLSTTTLSIGGSGALDLANNDLIATGTPRSTIENYIRTAYNFGDWLGASGLFSSSARNNPAGNTTLGLLSGQEFNDNNGSLFNGVTPAASNVLIKYTYYGDVDFNGSIDASDYNLIDFGFSNHLTGWSWGDADWSGGPTDVSDYNVIDFAFATQSGVL